MNNQKTFEAMRNEYDFLGEYIMRLESRAERGNGFGLTVIGGTLIFNENLESPILGIYLIIPFALSWILAMISSYWRNIFVMGTYRKVLEEKMNKATELNVYLWESKLTQKYIWSHRGTYAHQLSLSAIVIAILSYCFYKIIDTGNLWLTVSATMIFLINIITLLIVSFPNHGKLSKECHDFIGREMRKKAPDISTGDQLKP